MTRGESKTGLSWQALLLWIGLLLLAFFLALTLGSVSLPLRQVLPALADWLLGQPPVDTTARILIHVRLPRVLAVVLSGAALSLAGAAMQGLLQNPLADGSTLGISSGASLGAVLSIAFGLTLPGLPQAGTTLISIVFAFLSLILILSVAYRLDGQLSSNTIILIGVVFTMFVNAVISLVLAFSRDKLRDIVFWTMGSFNGSDMTKVLILLVALLPAGSLLFALTRELNALAVGEDNARAIGVPVRRIKLLILIAVSVLVGASVAVSGTIAFVGLIVPHMARFMVGPNHRRLLPVSFFFGAIFLLLADLTARTIVSPLELPVGVITSLIGAIVFVLLFFRARRAR